MNTEEILAAGGVGLVATLTAATLGEKHLHGMWLLAMTLECTHLQCDLLVCKDILIGLLDEVHHPSLGLEELGGLSLHRLSQRGLHSL